MIGLGWWGRKMKAVLQNAKQDIEIVCAAEPHASGADFAKDYGFKVYSDHKGALAHPGVEAVIQIRYMSNKSKIRLQRASIFSAKSLWP